MCYIVVTCTPFNDDCCVRPLLEKNRSPGVIAKLAVSLFTNSFIFIFSFIFIRVSLFSPKLKLELKPKRDVT